MTGRQYEEELREIAAEMRRALLQHGSLGTREQAQVGLAIGAVHSWIIAVQHGFVEWKHEDVGDDAYQARLVSTLAAIEEREPSDDGLVTKRSEWLATYYANSACLRMQALGEAWNWTPEHQRDLDRPGWGVVRNVGNRLKHGVDDILLNGHSGCTSDWVVARMREVAIELARGQPWGKSKPPKKPKKTPQACPNCGYVRRNAGKS